MKTCHKTSQLTIRFESQDSIKFAFLCRTSSYYLSKCTANHSTKIWHFIISLFIIDKFCFIIYTSYNYTIYENWQVHKIISHNYIQSLHFLGFKKSYNTDNILFAYRTFRHLFATIYATSHMTAFQNNTLNRRIPADFTQFFLAELFHICNFNNLFYGK